MSGSLSECPLLNIDLAGWELKLWYKVTTFYIPSGSSDQGKEIPEVSYFDDPILLELRQEYYEEDNRKHEVVEVLMLVKKDDPLVAYEVSTQALYRCDQDAVAGCLYRRVVRDNPRLSEAEKNFLKVFVEKAKQR